MTTTKVPAGLPAQMLTAAEAARVLNLSLRSVRRLIKDKKLPAIHVGRLVRIHPEALAALINGE
jgi:excisionase family DNA binding protein